MRAALLAGVMAVGLLLPSVSYATVVQFSGTWTGNESLQGTQRLSRNGSPTVAGTPSAYPGTIPDIPTYFSVLDLLVSPGTLVTVTEAGDNNITHSFFSIYNMSFSPTNLAQNYLGDLGTSAPGTTASIFAPTSGEIEIVANSSVGLSAIGSIYSATITYTPATAASPVPEPASLVLLCAGIVGLAAARRRRG